MCGKVQNTRLMKYWTLFI